MRAGVSKMLTSVTLFLRWFNVMSGRHFGHLMAGDLILGKKLREKRCSRRIREYAESWLRERRITVRRNYDEPVKGNQKKGLPQGATVTPILYNIYTSGITDNMEKGVESLQSKGMIENPLRTLIRNLRTLKLDIAEEKTQIVNFSPKIKYGRNKIEEYRIGHTIIEESRYAKFLGITIDNQLKMDRHTIERVNKGTNAKTALVVYSTLVKSVIEYDLYLCYTSERNRNIIDKVHQAGLILCARTAIFTRHDISRVNRYEVLYSFDGRSEHICREILHHSFESFKASLILNRA
ncbi:uncharacterized protein LOC143430484 [Xylocopa sonorina]|uniref:uncharacterized protein LOC143430484 n=1 Tax=Xylocopa sonorina TaxID=1818115 RepID=UPI00403AB793